MIKKYCYALTIFIYLTVLLLFPTTCVFAAKESLVLWFQVIIPTLFPFIFITYIIINSTLILHLNKLLSPILGRFFHLSGSASMAIVLGFLGGYPMGALITNNLYTNQLISKSEAKYLLAFTNNASPMFIIGFIGTLIGDPRLAYLLLFNLYFVAIVTGLIFRIFHKTSKPRQQKNTSYPQEVLIPISYPLLDQGIVQTATILLKIGGYMLLFAIPVEILQQVLPNTPYGLFMLSFAELGLGENIIANIPLKTAHLLPMFSALTAFGSLSVLGQTLSVMTSDDFSVADYLYPKIFQSIFAYFNMYLLLFLAAFTFM